MGASKVEGPSFRIVVDTREQTPWKFRRSGRCLGVVERKLPTGDYSLEGYEDKFVIERKATPAELAKNMGEARWLDELVRLREFPSAYIVCEFTMKELLAYPRGTKIPARARKSIRLRGPFLLRRVCEYMRDYGIPFIFAGEEAQTVALSLMKRATEGDGSGKG